MLRDLKSNDERITRAVEYIEEELRLEEDEVNDKGMSHVSDYYSLLFPSSCFSFALPECPQETSPPYAHFFFYSFCVFFPPTLSLPLGSQYSSAF